MSKKSIGDVVQWEDVRDVNSQELALPDSQKWVHLQFRRFASCPMCNLHLREYAQRYQEVEAAGARSVAVFTSTPEDVKALQNDLPFSLISDPEEKLYAQFGVKKSLMAVMHPATIAPGMKGMFRHGMKLPGKSDRKLGLPADFLIDTEGTIRALKYGIHAYDQWSLDELLQTLKGLR